MTAKKLTPWLFLAVPLLLYFFWIIGPALYTMYLSLTEWDGLSAPIFIGFDNFRLLFFGDPVFITSLMNNVKWLLIFLVIPVILGLSLAMILNRNIQGEKFFKAAIYSPMILSPAVIGLIWGWIYDPAGGLLNTTLSVIGVKGIIAALMGLSKGANPGWLSDPDIVLYCIIAAAAWRHTGYVMILYLTGLKGIPGDVIEAAKVDGAKGWTLFWHILLPLLKPATIIVVVVTIIESLRAFDMVNIMTQGGPFNSSNVLANFMYMEAFKNYRMGYGAAIAVVLFIIMFGFIVLYLREVVKSETDLS
ncbi:binding-protein-dependent transport systems inner membrane component [Candidatus Vecturithrix granuli]|uniref:Binding-protein-dependent transport systems inner membrane component n=1 Tax=Vecturithrix granuli TaxID=1499967 RepID=A0A081C2G1_VECG1|nr:binding-protein-dependent transport systems inner membrane component [Candidatus Vecturithrix granuli]